MKDVEDNISELNEENEPQKKKKIPTNEHQRNIQMDDNNENIYYIKFDIKSFQYYILKALNDLQEVPDEVKNYYYDKLHKDVIFSKDKFINYLAGQSPEYYYVETFIAYILSPDKLKQLDKKMFDYWVNEIERR